MGYEDEVVAAMNATMESKQPPTLQDLRRMMETWKKAGHGQGFLFLSREHASIITPEPCPPEYPRYTTPGFGAALHKFHGLLDDTTPVYIPHE